MLKHLKLLGETYNGQENTLRMHPYPRGAFTGKVKNQPKYILTMLFWLSST